jgi:hypothetical protein
MLPQTFCIALSLSNFLQLVLMCSHKASKASLSLAMTSYTDEMPIDADLWKQEIIPIPSDDKNPFAAFLGPHTLYKSCFRFHLILTSIRNNSFVPIPTNEKDNQMVYEISHPK